MRFYQWFATAVAFSHFTSAQHLDSALIKARDDIPAVETLITSLGLSGFCSSFVAITDSTTIATQTGTTATTVVTVRAPCTNAFKRDVKWTPTCRLITTQSATLTTTAETSSTTSSSTTSSSTTKSTTTSSSTTKSTTTTSSTTKSTTTSSSTTKSTTTTSSTTKSTTTSSSTTKSTTTSSSTTKSTTTTTSSAGPRCAATGVPQQLVPYDCAVISNACKAVVTPKTVTVTTFQPGPTNTGTKTVTPTCPITTTRNRNPSTTPATILATN